MKFTTLSLTSSTSVPWNIGVGAARLMSNITIAKQKYENIWVGLIETILIKWFSWLLKLEWPKIFKDQCIYRTRGLSNILGVCVNEKILILAPPSPRYNTMSLKCPKKTFLLSKIRFVAIFAIVWIMHYFPYQSTYSRS